MMGRRNRGQEQLFYEFHLDEVVPVRVVADDRKLDGLPGNAADLERADDVSLVRRVWVLGSVDTPVIDGPIVTAGSVDDPAFFKSLLTAFDAAASRPAPPATRR